MDENNIPENPPEITPNNPFQYEPTAVAVVCTWMECGAGHKWQPTIQVTPCPGCKAPMLAAKMTNCPQCNEPSTALQLRMDHLPKGGAITPICRGGATLADTHTIAVVLDHAAREQVRYVQRELPSKI